MFRKVAAFFALFAMTVCGMAQISGTNAVSMLEDNVTNTTATVWPLVIGIITALVALSVFLRVGRKGGIKA